MRQGWKSGQCKPRDEDIPLNVLDADNMRALRHGTQYADIVSLIAEAAHAADVTTSLPDLRTLIVISSEPATLRDAAHSKAGLTIGRSSRPRGRRREHR